jgi:regulator of cell morphogenesis and NO signaling
MTDERAAGAAPVAPPVIDPQWSVNELLQRYPKSARVLNALGVDTCCGGASSLVDAAAEVGLDPSSLLVAVADASAEVSA